MTSPVPSAVTSKPCSLEPELEGDVLGVGLARGREGLALEVLGRGDVRAHHERGAARGRAADDA